MSNKKGKILTKVYLIIGTIFTILTFIGAGYVIANKGQVNAGYAVVPMLFSIIFMGFFRESLNKKDKK